jgi:UDP-N-acetylmuramyl tripeptide synthase
VFGCGGNRDATKRPLMGAIAERLADRVVLTSDNPRASRPGLHPVADPGRRVGRRRRGVIEDRRRPSPHAVARGRAGDVVLLAGKGHEDYQEMCRRASTRSPTWPRRAPRWRAEPGAAHDR